MLFPGISCKNVRKKVFSYVIPLKKNESGKTLLFFQKPELDFPSKMWLKLDIVVLFCFYQEFISNLWQKSMISGSTFHYLLISSHHHRKNKYSFDSKAS